MRRLRFLEQAQWWERDRIDAYRGEALRALIRTAYHEVPFYRERMERAGLAPDDIRSPRDLHRLPAVTKASLRQRYPKDTVRPTGLATYETTTSGSTGTNFAVIEDAFTAGHYRASFLLALHWAGWNLGEAHVQNGINVHRSNDRKWKDWLLRCHYLTAYNVSDRYLDEALDRMDAKRIRHLWGYPPSLYYLAQRAAQRGWNAPLKSVVTWGDTLYPHYRRSIERAFGVRINDTYGCGEGFQIAAQCGAGSHYHVHELDVIVEYVDEGGCPARPGEPGNVLITRLHPGPMPLIRYQVGDRAAPSALEACPCGRHWELMDSIQGRDTDVVTTPGGNRLIVHFFTGVLAHFQEIDSYQVVQEKVDSIRIRVTVNAASQFTPQLERAIKTRLRENGADLEIEMEPVESIPVAASGKRRFVISRLGPTAGGARNASTETAQVVK
ncbi:MAG: hypothetical protein R2729_09020 [Bryobacteraceae bacterium]